MLLAVWRCQHDAGRSKPSWEILQTTLPKVLECGSHQIKNSVSNAFQPWNPHKCPYWLTRFWKICFLGSLDGASTKVASNIYWCSFINFPNISIGRSIWCSDVGQVYLLGSFWLSDLLKHLLKQFFFTQACIFCAPLQKWRQTIIAITWLFLLKPLLWPAPLLLWIFCIFVLSYHFLNSFKWGNLYPDWAHCGVVQGNELTISQ